MGVVADTSPLNYLVLIGESSVLPALFHRVVIPEAVQTELMKPKTSKEVRAWIERPPDWLEIRQVANPSDATLEKLHAGEREAIRLAEEIAADYLIMDER